LLTIGITDTDLVRVSVNLSSTALFPIDSVLGWIGERDAAVGAAAPAPDVEHGEAFHQMECLAYDPAVSLHYEVFLIPFLPDDPQSMLEPEMLQSEWPPSPYALQVFSSATGRWEEKLFGREGPAAGTKYS
jgi:hypothetical protein